ncbi:MAG: lytic transglycosylase domain-containing protein [Leucobacter sp.]
MGTPRQRANRRRGRRSRLPVVLVVTLGVLGIAALATAVLLLMEGRAATAADPAPRAASNSEAPGPAPSQTAEAEEPAITPISELVDPAWVEHMAAAADIPDRALKAYVGAAIEASEAHPDCGIGWNTLAAIGLVETGHGSIHGAKLAADGTVSPTIVGIPLDGNGTIPVSDTDGGALDGDTQWDRAVGPMQFIPSTWEIAAQDGNRDGVTDINQIDDAALAAAMHLCEVGGDLTQPENWIAAVSAYNPSLDYNHRVADAANHYATLE